MSVFVCVNTYIWHSETHEKAREITGEILGEKKLLRIARQENAPGRSKFEIRKTFKKKRKSLTGIMSTQKGELREELTREWEWDTADGVVEGKVWLPEGC